MVRNIDVLLSAEIVKTVGEVYVEYLEADES